jgi:hypothetical protein
MGVGASELVTPRAQRLHDEITGLAERHVSKLLQSLRCRTLAVRISLCLTSSSNYRPVFPRTPDDRHSVVASLACLPVIRSKRRRIWSQ